MASTNLDPNFIEAQELTRLLFGHDEAQQRIVREWLGRGGTLASLIGGAPTYSTALEQFEYLRFVTWALANSTYRGGDVPDRITLADNRKLYLLADPLVGSIDADGTMNTVAPARNGLLVESAAGAFTSQFFLSGAAGVAFEPNQTTWPGAWYWPIAGIAEGNNVRVACLLQMSGGEHPFGTTIGNHIVTLDDVGFDVQSVLSTLDGFAPLGTIQQMVAGGDGFTYIVFGFQTGGATVANFKVGNLASYGSETRLARCPTGQVTNLFTWELRTRTGWANVINGVTENPSRHYITPLMDTSGALLDGDIALRPVPGGWMAITHQLLEPHLRLYTSATIDGAYTLRTLVPCPYTIHSPSGGRTVSYFLRAFTGLTNQPPDTLMTFASRNVFFSEGAIGNHHVSRYCPGYAVVPIVSP